MRILIIEFKCLIHIEFIYHTLRHSISIKYCMSQAVGSEQLT